MKTKTATNEIARKVRCRLSVTPVFRVTAGIIGTGLRFGTSVDFDESIVALLV